MKKNNSSLTKFTAFVLLVTMIALVLISGTFAKYAEEYAGTSTAIVAKWDVSVTDLNDAEITESTSFNLFDKSKVYDLASVANVNDLSAETGTVESIEDVKEGTDNAIVAPGTWGKIGFKVNVKATNEVKVEYGVTVTDIQNNITPLEFSVDGKTWVKSDAVNTLAKKTLKAGETTAAGGDTITLYWRWLYENGTAEALKTNDGTDTELGTAGTATCVVTAVFGAKQVN